MKALPLILTVYCALAVLALGALIILGVAEVQELQRELPDAERQLAESHQARNTAKLNYDQLAERQRDERGGYDGAQAIRMSYDVQEAKTRFRVAQEHTDSAQERADTLRDDIERNQMRFIPLAALLLLHILGIAIFWPWRERKAAKRAR